MSINNLISKSKVYTRPWETNNNNNQIPSKTFNNNNTNHILNKLNRFNNNLLEFSYIYNQFKVHCKNKENYNQDKKISHLLKTMNKSNNIFQSMLGKNKKLNTK